MFEIRNTRVVCCLWVMCEFNGPLDHPQIGISNILCYVAFKCDPFSYYAMIAMADGKLLFRNWIRYA